MIRLVKVIGVLLGFVAIAFGAGFFLPSTVHVERDILIHAQPAEIFSLISDFQEWDAWSPWANLDPNAKMVITGSGIGQTMTWSSDDPQVGNGSQQLTEMNEPTFLKTHLDFGGQGVADASFQLRSEGDETRVIWSLDSDSREGVSVIMQPVNTYFGYLMDSMVGNQYETGLENLKAVVENMTMS